MRLAVSHAVEDRLFPAGWGVDVETIDEAAKSGPSAAVGRKLRKEADIVAVVGALAPATAGPLEVVTTKESTTLLRLSPAATARQSAGTNAGTNASGSASPPVPLPPLTLRMVADEATTGTYVADYLLGSVLSVVAVPGGTASAPSVTANDGSENARAFVGGLADRLTAAGLAVTPLGLASTADDKVTPAFVSKAFAATPPIVVFGGAVSAALPLSAAAQSAAVRATFVSGGQVGVAGCADSLSVLAEGDLCAAAATPLSTSVRARAFREDYAAAGYGAPTVSVTAAYDAATMVIRALRPALSGLGADPDPDEVRAPMMAALRTSRLDGATGATNFDAEGDRVTAAISVLRKQSGKWVAVAATAP